MGPGTDHRRLPDPRAGQPAHLCGRADLQTAAGHLRAADRFAQSRAIGQKLVQSGSTESGAAHRGCGDWWTRTRSALRFIERAARPPLRRRAAGDESIVDAPTRNSHGHLLAVREPPDGTETGAEAVSTSLVWRPRGGGAET